MKLFTHVLTFFLVCILTACGGSSEEQQENLLPTDTSGPSGSNKDNQPQNSSTTANITIAKMNELLAQASSNHFAHGMTLSCDEENVGGCYIQPDCYATSQTWSSKFIYDIGQNEIKVIQLTWLNGECSGDYQLGKFVGSLWNYQSKTFNDNTQHAVFVVENEYYADGFVLADRYSKPFKGMVGKTFMWRDTSGDVAQLCISASQFKDGRPLFIMGTAPIAIDSSNCAQEIE